MIIVLMPDIKEVHSKPKLYVSVNLFWSMAAMLRDSVAAVVVVVVVRTRPRTIPLAVITMGKSTHGFPFLSHDAYGAPLGGPSGRRSSAISTLSRVHRKLNTQILNNGFMHKRSTTPRRIYIRLNVIALRSFQVCHNSTMQSLNLNHVL